MARKESAMAATEVSEFAMVEELLGGSQVLGHRVRSPFDVHEALRQGLPGMALMRLVGKVRILRNSALLEPAVGVSARTVQRFKVNPKKALSVEQSGRLWKFAEILAKASEVLGSQEEAERWLDRPAMALNQRRPIELLVTPAGVKLVEDLLGRMEYGAYT